MDLWPSLKWILLYVFSQHSYYSGLGREDPDLGKRLLAQLGGHAVPGRFRLTLLDFQANSLEG